jgi:type IV pilus assembly protein PilV
MKSKREFGAGWQGHTLIEVLIAAVVLSVSLIPLLKMQTATQALNDSASMRSFASHKAYELADRVRANQLGLLAGAYNNLSGAGSNPSCISSGCTPTQLAANDWYEWNADLAQNLPNGQAAFCIDSTPNDGTPTSPACDGLGNAFAVKVWWTDDRSGSLKRFVTTLRP